MDSQAIQKKMDNYMETATPEQIVKEFEDLGVEFIEYPSISIHNNKITFHNLRRSNGTTPLTLNIDEVLIYHEILNNFLSNYEFYRTTATES